METAREADLAVESFCRRDKPPPAVRPHRFGNGFDEEADERAEATP